MVDIIDNKWTQRDDGNISASPDGVQGGYSPKTVAPIIQAIRGAVKREWVSSNPAFTSTGTANNYALSFDQPLEIGKGKRISFFANVTNTGASTINLNTLGAVAIVRNDGSPLQAGDIVANMPVDLVYDGTRFVLTSSPILSNISGTIKATAFEGNGSALTNINASNISSGTLNNARLPATMTGKTFSSETTISAGGLKITAGDIVVSTGGVGIGGDLAVTGKTSLVGDTSVVGTLSQGGSRVLTLADTGVGKGLNADLLDDKHGSFYLARENHTGTQPVSTITGLDTVLTAKVSKAGDTMTGNLVLSNGSNPTPITFNAANGSITAGGLVHIQSSGTNAAVLEMRAPANASAIIDFSPNGYGGDFVWRINAHPDTASFDIIHTGTHRFRLRNDGAIWNSYSGWLHDKFADRGAQIQHNSGVWEFGSIDPNYNDRTTDAPNPWVLVGLRGARGTNVINMRAVWLRNN
ncbi:hypothetical protein CFBP6625_06185 [Agrobacterium tumefaciens]|nr:hypothetical protein CFBP6625_06185 [Agrobacterium tumefaciens]